MDTHVKSIFSIVAMVAIGFFLYACSSTKEVSDSSADANEFFDPAATIVKSQPGNANLNDVAANKSENNKDRVPDQKPVEGALTQNERLSNVLHQLQSADPRFSSGNIAVNRLEETLEDRNPGRTLSSDRQIVELLKEQNARLIDVLEQLKTIIIQRDVAARQSSANSNRTRTVKQVKTLAAIDAKVEYGRAIRLYEDRKYDEAIAAFKRLLLKLEDDELADNCRFWVGVSNFNLQKYTEAIPQFKHLLVHQWFEKKEAAYIMLGQCYEQAGERSLAKATYQRLVQLNPVCDLAYVAHLKIAML